MDPTLVGCGESAAHVHMVVLCTVEGFPGLRGKANDEYRVHRARIGVLGLG